MTGAINRFDLMVCCENLDLRLAPKSAEAFLRNLAVTRVARPHAEAVAEDWVEVYMEPGASDHEIFIKGARTHDEPMFLEAAIRFGLKPTSLEYGAAGTNVNFFLEFRGCLYDDTNGVLKKRFHDITGQRCQIFSRKHVALPPHREVPEDEKPKEKPKRSSGAGGAGTRVEEF